MSSFNAIESELEAIAAGRAADGEPHEVEVRGSMSWNASNSSSAKFGSTGGT